MGTIDGNPEALHLDLLWIVFRADLLEHAYLLMRLNAYLVLGLGQLPEDLTRFRRARFDALS